MTRLTHFAHVPGGMADDTDCFSECAAQSARGPDSALCGFQHERAVPRHEDHHPKGYDFAVNETFTTVTDPRDMTYTIQRQEQIDELLKLSPTQLDRRLNWQINSPSKIRDDHNVSGKALGDIVNSPMMPAGLRKSILDTTGTTTGNVLIRQDLEATLLKNRAFIW